MFLQQSTDAKNRKIKITKLHQPTPLFVTKSAEDLVKSPRFANRGERFQMPASYANFYTAKKVIIVLNFNDLIWDKMQSRL